MLRRRWRGSVGENCESNTMSSLVILALVVTLFKTDADSGSANSTELSALRAAKCIIPNGPDHITRAALLQQCISKNYAQGNETQCYPELGCFEMEYPWVSALRPVPSPLHPAEINVRVYCYTRASPQRYNITLWPEISMEGCPFNSSRRTVFITHGFANDGNSSWLSDMKDNYLTQVDADIFLVDWGQGAQLYNYLQVASNARIVGAEIVRFLKHLTIQEGFIPTDLHLIGHSLGAHVLSYAAKGIPGVGRITGSQLVDFIYSNSSQLSSCPTLDPAQPLFEGSPAEVRLDETDADYVEVVHTNAAPFIPYLGFGMISPRGHVDFYMNGGAEQPGCDVPDVPNITSLQDLENFPVEILFGLVSCSHRRSFDYYTQVLKDNCIIWGRKASTPRKLLNALTSGFLEPLFASLQTCDAQTCIPLTLNTPRFSARGTFSCTTTKSAPYCETDQKENSKLFSEISVERNSSTKTIGSLLAAVVGKGADVMKTITSGLAEIGGQ